MPGQPEFANSGIEEMLEFIDLQIASVLLLS